MTNISLTNLTVANIETILLESPHFRQLVATWLVNASVPDKVEALRAYVKAQFGPSTKIPAIKYVRQWAVDNKYPELDGLALAKAFVDKIIVYYPTA